MQKIILKELTPIVHKCDVMATCPGVYAVEMTPETHRCVIGATCPAVYTMEMTPESMRCHVGESCPGVFDGAENEYFIIGTHVDPIGTEFEKKVGEGEALIRISKALVNGAVDNARTVHQ